MSLRATDDIRFFPTHYYGCGNQPVTWASLPDTGWMKESLIPEGAQFLPPESDWTCRDVEENCDAHGALPWNFDYREACDGEMLGTFQVSEDRRTRLMRVPNQAVWNSVMMTHSSVGWDFDFSVLAFDFASAPATSVLPGSPSPNAGYLPEFRVGSVKSNETIDEESGEELSVIAMSDWEDVCELMNIATEIPFSVDGMTPTTEGVARRRLMIRHYRAALDWDHMPIRFPQVRLAETCYAGGGGVGCLTVRYVSQDARRWCSR